MAPAAQAWGWQATGGERYLDLDAFPGFKLQTVLNFLAFLACRAGVEVGLQPARDPVRPVVGKDQHIPFPAGRARGAGLPGPQPADRKHIAKVARKAQRNGYRRPFPPIVHELQRIMDGKLDGIDEPPPGDTDPNL
jgi:hypothetical protein